LKPLLDLRDTPFRLFIHDELCIEIESKDDRRQYLAALARVMPLRVPVRVDSKITSATWADAKDDESCVYIPALGDGLPRLEFFVPKK
jgi:hypothetical protein